MPQQFPQMMQGYQPMNWGYNMPQMQQMPSMLAQTQTAQKTPAKTASKPADQALVQSNDDMQMGLPQEILDLELKQQMAPMQMQPMYYGPYGMY